MEESQKQKPTRCCSLEIEPWKVRTATSHGSGKWELPAINTSTPESGLSNWQTTPSGAGGKGGRVVGCKKLVAGVPQSVGQK